MGDKRVGDEKSKKDAQPESSKLSDEATTAKLLVSVNVDETKRHVQPSSSKEKSGKERERDGKDKGGIKRKRSASPTEVILVSTMNYVITLLSIPSDFPVRITSLRLLV